MAFRVVPLWSRRLAETDALLQDKAGRETAGLLGPKSYSTKPKRLFAAGFEALIDGLGLLGGDRNLLVLLAQLFVDKSERVIAGRQALDFVLPALIGNGIERVFHHIHIHLHPRVLIALYWQHDFFAGEGLLYVSGGRRLRFVPFAIVLRRRVNIVCGRICVLDVNRLTRHHTQHVGMVLAALLL